MWFLFFYVLFYANKAYAQGLNPTYETTYNFLYGADEVVVYYEDFSNKTFESESEIVDYIYNVGYERDCSDNRYSVFGHKLTPSEIKLFITHFWLVSKLFDWKNEALSKTNEIFGYTTDDSDANAFCHTYWTMIMAYDIGYELALKFVLAHEDYDSNPSMSKEMDIFNDNAAYEWCKYNEKSDSWLDGSAALFLFNSQKLKYIIKNYKYLKTVVINTKLHKSTYVYDYCDLFCYTNSKTPLNIPSTTYETIGPKDGFSTISEV